MAFCGGFVLIYYTIHNQYGQILNNCFKINSGSITKQDNIAFNRTKCYRSLKNWLDLRPSGFTRKDNLDFYLCCPFFFVKTRLFLIRAQIILSGETFRECYPAILYVSSSLCLSIRIPSLFIFKIPSFLSSDKILTVFSVDIPLKSAITLRVIVFSMI